MAESTASAEMELQASVGSGTDHEQQKRDQDDSTETTHLLRRQLRKEVSVFHLVPS